MGLSNDLISQFVKITNDNKNREPEKTTAYGTVVEYAGNTYVQLDGSDLLTPIDTTTEITDNDRVLVNINNHHALVTGNVSNPAIGKVTAGALSSEIKQTAESLTLTVSNTRDELTSYINQTASGLTMAINDTRNDLVSMIEQSANDITLMFKNGYSEGQTIVNQNGIRVMHTAYNGYTHIAAHGFSLYKDGQAIFTCSPSGLNYTGTITASTIRSTDGSFRIDQNGNITGASLKSSQGGNFSIDENGSITAVGLSVEGNVSTNTLVCKEISNKAYPKTLTGSVTLWVGSSGNDDNECVNGAVFKTLQGAIDSLPKFLNGKVVYIKLLGNHTGNANFTYFTSGRIFLLLCGYKLYGNVHFYHMTATTYIYGGDSSSSTAYGTIHPSIGLDAGGRTASISINQCKNIALYYLYLYGADNYAANTSSQPKVGVGSQGGGYTYVSNVRIYNCKVGFRGNSGVHMYISSSYGIASQYGFQAHTGAIISINSAKQAGGSTAPTSRASSGQIFYDSPTFESGSASSGGGSASTGSTTTTKTFTASSAQALQYAGTSSAFWRTDCKPKAGNWGYGAHTGWWFFGDDFEAMANKNVTKIEITFTRNTAGNHGNVQHKFYVHNYETQPSTAKPTYNSSSIGSASVAVEKTHTISITNATTINRIKTAKGICIVPPSQSSTYYSVMSPTMKVKFTYTT